MEADLENYRYQLQQIEDGLLRDPKNEELLKLRTDLGEMISLTERLLGVPASSTTPSGGDSDAATKAKDSSSLQSSTETELASVKDSSQKHSNFDGVPLTSRQQQQQKTNFGKSPGKVLFNIGDLVLAKWSGDGRYYEARIEAIDVSGDYTVSFTTYGTTEFVSADSIRPIPVDPISGEGHASKKRALLDPNAATQASGAGQGIAGASGVGDAARGIVRKKKKRTLEEQHAKKAQEQADKQKGWLDFNSKMASKHKKTGINNNSIFATSENPNSRVGVSGSGKGMTRYDSGVSKGRNTIK